MNKHLEPIFNMILSELTENSINYWVYGGIAVAALAGKFIRKNKDVDIFINEIDMDFVRSILESRCYDQNLFWNECHLLKRDGYSRPKLEVREGRNELLSIIPVYLNNGQPILVFGNGAKTYSPKLLIRKERNLSKYKFFTPPDEYIKEIFINCFRYKRGWKERSEIRKDAQVVLSAEDYKRYFS
jgi:hypothetical protein